MRMNYSIRDFLPLRNLAFVSLFFSTTRLSREFRYLWDKFVKSLSFPLNKVLTTAGGYGGIPLLTGIYFGNLERHCSPPAQWMTPWDWSSNLLDYEGEKGKVRKGRFNMRHG